MNRSWLTCLRCAVFSGILTAAALTMVSCEREPPDAINALWCGQDDMRLPRAPDGDFLCLDKDDCYVTPGTPVGGCPNTCSCLCMYNVCYQYACTLVPCDEPPIYR